MTEYEKMVSGQPYWPGDPELCAARAKAQTLCKQYNETSADDWEQRAAILRQLLGKAGRECWFMPNFRCDYGVNISIGNRFFANYDCVFLDVAPITIGDDVLIGPQTGLYTATHPLEPALRKQGVEGGKPITLENGVWLGGHVTVCPGVTIGENTVVAAGSVVTKDLPANVVAGGNPCKVIKPITDERQ